MAITSSLRFLYILGGSGLLWGSSLNFLIRDFENRLSSVSRRKTFVIYGFSFIQIRQEDFETVIEKLLHMLTYNILKETVRSFLVFYSTSLKIVLKSM